MVVNGMGSFQVNGERLFADHGRSAITSKVIVLSTGCDSMAA
jgi:hypothetical protein